MLLKTIKFKSLPLGDVAMFASRRRRKGFKLGGVAVRLVRVQRLQIHRYQLVMSKLNVKNAEEILLTELSNIVERCVMIVAVFYSLETIK